MDDKKPKKWGSFTDADVYHEYYKRERKKLGFDKYDDERSYVGSILNTRIDLHPEVDAEYLKGIMPRSHTVKESILDILESRCTELMRIKAAEGKRCCTFTIPEIVPGYPYTPPEKVISPLVDRISKRKGIVCCALETPEAYILKIYWE